MAVGDLVRLEAVSLDERGGMSSTEHAGHDGQVKLVDRTRGEQVRGQDAPALAKHHLAAALAPEPLEKPRHVHLGGTELDESGVHTQARARALGHGRRVRYDRLSARGSTEHLRRGLDARACTRHDDSHSARRQIRVIRAKIARTDENGVGTRAERMHPLRIFPMARHREWSPLPSGRDLAVEARSEVAKDPWPRLSPAGRRHAPGGLTAALSIS